MVRHHLGCDRCGLVVHRADVGQEVLRVDGRGLGYGCLACGGEMRPIGLREAIDLAREAREAQRWRVDGGTSQAVAQAV